MDNKLLEQKRKEKIADFILKIAQEECRKLGLSPCRDCRSCYDWHWNAYSLIFELKNHECLSSYEKPIEQWNLLEIPTVVKRASTYIQYLEGMEQEGWFTFQQSGNTE